MIVFASQFLIAFIATGLLVLIVLAHYIEYGTRKQRLQMVKNIALLSLFFILLHNLLIYAGV